MGRAGEKGGGAPADVSSSDQIENAVPHNRRRRRISRDNDHASTSGSRDERAESSATRRLSSPYRGVS